MKKENVLKLILFVVFVLVLAYLAIFGLKIGDKTIIKSVKNINTGLDISGGVTIVYEAKLDDGSNASAEDLSKASVVMKKRLEKANIFDYIVRTDEATSQIYIEIPTSNKDESADPLEVVKGLDKTAKVEFRDKNGNVLLSGTDIKSAKYSDEAVDTTGLPSPHVVLTFSEEGTTKFAAATEAVAGSTLGIYLDDESISEPTVNEKIESSTAIITMGSSSSYAERKEEAQNLALLIDSGALPVTLNCISKDYVGPYIGQQALSISIKAAIVALIVIAIILIVLYKVPGVIASLSLVAYISITLLIMTITGISLTLPGIASLILSIGMAVDANVIIFERFKEEMKGKVVSADRAFERSFKNAMAAIIDGNITTCTVAILLYIFGTGTVKGFGITLAIGVIVSLFTAIVLTKFALKQIIMLANKNRWVFGAKKEVEE